MNNIDLNARIQKEISQLVELSQANSTQIAQQQESIKKLKHELKSINNSITYSKENSNSISDTDNTIKSYQRESQSNQQQIINTDCKDISATVNNIKDYIHNDNIETAIKEAGKFVKQSQHLERRVHYIYQLQQLIKLYEKEKLVQGKLSAIAEVLGLKLPNTSSDASIKIKSLPSNPITYKNANKQPPNNPKNLH